MTVQLEGILLSKDDLEEMADANKILKLKIF